MPRRRRRVGLASRRRAGLQSGHPLQVDDRREPRRCRPRRASRSARFIDASSHHLYLRPPAREGRHHARRAGRQRRNSSTPGASRRPIGFCSPCRSSTSTAGNGVHSWPLGLPHAMLERFDHRPPRRRSSTSGRRSSSASRRCRADAEIDESRRERSAALRLCVWSAPPAAGLEEFDARFGQRILERYGMTETLMTLGNPQTASVARAPSTGRLPASPRASRPRRTPTRRLACQENCW